MEPQLIADYACQVGEGPVWHPMEKRVYWLDIPQGRMFRYEPANGKHEMCYEGIQVGGITVQADGSLLLYMEKGAIAVWRNGKLSYIVKEIPAERDHRFNDVFTDPAGRVFCGTMATKGNPGRLYRLDLDGSIHVALDNVGISNGGDFTPDRKQMYYTDSTPRRIYLFDYDQKTGAISNQRTFVETPGSEDGPDGMTVDAQGYVWSARWDGWRLIRYTPKGVEERSVKFPARKVSSVCFGGDDLTDMYVTTAGGQDKVANGPGAGALFKVNLGIKGAPEPFSRVGL